MTSEERKIQDLESLVAAVLEVTRHFQGQVWWRGQGRFSWDLSPSVARADGGHRYEQNMILRFKQRAPSRHTHTPSQDDLFGWLFLMQHYRLPTRLLDWTESPLFACYFAIEGNNTVDDDGSLFAINPYLLNQSQVGEYGLFMPHDARSVNAIKKAFRSDAQDVDYVVAILPSETQIRMRVQLSVFTIHGSGRAMDDLPDADKFLIKFRIPSESKKVLRQQLEYLGIRESNLFPDLEHLAKEIRALTFKPPPKTAEASRDEEEFGGVG